MIGPLLALGLALQDPEIGRLLDRLEDDSVEARDGAFRELAARGTGALVEIRRRAASAQGEFRIRLEGLVREIERRARAEAAQGTPSRVSLKADRRPLRDAVEEIRRQSPLAIEIEEAAGDDPVTLEFRELPVFEALDRLCRAHGKVVLRLPWHVKDRAGGRSPVRLLRGTDAETRRHVDGAVVVDLREVRRLDASDFQGKTERDLELVFQAAWEPSLRPTAVRFSVTSIEDERGGSPGVKPRGSLEGEWDRALNLHYPFHLATIPPPGADSFRKVSGLLELRFPSDVFEARIENPVGRSGVRAEGGEASFTLKSFALDQGVYRVSLESDGPPGGLDGGLRFEARDTRGRPLGRLGLRASGRGPADVTLSFRPPEGAEVAELRAILLKEDPPVVRRIPWTFRDVPVR